MMIADARPKVYPPRWCSDAWGRPKVGFTTRKDAQRQRRRGHMDQHPYLCECGYWHLASHRLNP